MQSKEEAFKVLNLSETADRPEIEQAYRRLVRRYPPKFNSEKFRQIDEAYRLLTSLPFLLEQLLNPDKKEATLPADLFSFDPSPPEGLLEQALAELQSLSIKDYLWFSLNPQKP